MHIFFSVGEPSGDQHAAHLITALKRRRPDIECSGFGGPRMRDAGCPLDCELTNYAVMGVLQVLPLIWTFLKLVRDAGRIFSERRPDAVVLVDFPGFNWWIARKAKRAGIPVFYYLPPQLWAWASWRVRRMRKHVDHILCGLPFEPKWYAERGLKAEYVGHPFFDEIAQYQLDKTFLRDCSEGGKRVVGVLPGSRRHEVEHNFPLQIKVMRRLVAKHSDLRFLVACFKESQRARCEEMLAKHADLPVQLCLGKTPEIIEASHCCLMVSGSVSLEIMARSKPAVVFYSVTRTTYFLFRLLIRKQMMSLPNRMATRMILPEWLIIWRPRRDVRQMTRTVDRWLSEPLALATVIRDLSRLREEHVQTGATGRTADAILSHLRADAATSLRRAA